MFGRRRDRLAWEEWSRWVSFCQASDFCVAQIGPHNSGRRGFRRHGRYATLHIVYPPGNPSQPAWFEETKPSDGMIVVVRRGRNVGWGQNYGEPDVVYVDPQRGDLYSTLSKKLLAQARRHERRLTKRSSKAN